jgi:hypothetical protein
VQLFLSKQNSQYVFTPGVSHTLAGEFSDIYHVRQALHPGVVIFMCWQLGKRYVVYDTKSRKVLRKVFIDEHSDCSLEYAKPIGIPTLGHELYPCIFAVRDNQSLFLFDVREDGESYQVATNIISGYGLSQVSFVSNSSNKVLLYTTTWY